MVRISWTGTAAPAAVLLAALYLPGHAEAGRADERARAAIEWKLPDQFEAARDQAQRDKRLLIVKGVSFGIDQAGATCATKGKW